MSPADYFSLDLRLMPADDLASFHRDPRVATPMIFSLFVAAATKAPMHPIGVTLCVGGGAFAILGAWRNWDWFFAWHPAPTFVALLGRAGARIFYVLLGLFLFLGGILAGFGIIE